jgi:hypothetical protein
MRYESRADGEKTSQKGKADWEEKMRAARLDDNDQKFKVGDVVVVQRYRHKIVSKIERVTKTLVFIEGLREKFHHDGMKVGSCCMPDFWHPKPGEVEEVEFENRAQEACWTMHEILIDGISCVEKVKKVREILETMVFGEQILPVLTGGNLAPNK